MARGDFFGLRPLSERESIQQDFRSCFQITVLDTTLVPEAWRSEEGRDLRPRSTMDPGYCGSMKFPLRGTQAATRVAQMHNRLLFIATGLCLQVFGAAQARRDPFQAPASGNPWAPLT